MNGAYLKIENPGVAPTAAFTLLGASTKRDTSSGQTIGKFGTGNKHGIAVCLRNKLSPMIFAGTLKMEFGTRPEKMENHVFNRVVVKYGGKDEQGVSRRATEDLGFVVEHGAVDWQGVDLALREFVSNALDRAVEEGELNFLSQLSANEGSDFVQEAMKNNTWQYYSVKDQLSKYRETAQDFKNVTIEVVSANQVRARAGYTRIFVPLNDEVFKFYNNLSKWFLHFTEPESLHLQVLPKRNRSITSEQGAVIYRRGVRVREVPNASLFDYNLEDLKLDESRQVDNWLVSHEAAKAFSQSDESILAALFQTFLDNRKVWEHSFDNYGLEKGIANKDASDRWVKAFARVAGDNGVLSTVDGGKLAARKGFTIVNAPEHFVTAAIKYGVPTPQTVLTADEKNGREIFEATPQAIEAVDFAWSLVLKHKLSNGKNRPEVKTYRQIMNFGSQTLGFYNNNTVYLNLDLCDGGDGLNHQLLMTAFEEVAHHVSGACDFSRDFQDFILNLMVHCARV